ncbi:MAG: response regulator transcription factor [Williamsia sp.]|nr:response regulator transcription factor [Williamsia sp.]
MRILVAEDEPVVANLIKKTLEEEQYEVTLAPDGQTAWDYLSRFLYDAVVLDIMLPVVNGLEICRRCRKEGNQVPILLLTALGTTDNIVVGLDSGADDYLTKPFKVAELLARLRSLLRRKQAAHQPHEVSRKNVLTLADLVMDLDEKQVVRNGSKVDLTVTEFRLLEYLLRNSRRVLSRMDILENVWGYDFNMNTKVVDVYINYLRKKLDNDAHAKLIHTVTGMGYVLKE